MNFCSQLRPNDYKGLMQAYSTTVVFVLMEYTFKTIESTINPTNVNELKPLLVAVQDVTMSWFTKDAVFVREGKILDRYVEKSIGRTIGQMQKFLYVNKETRAWLMSTLK